MVPSIQETKRNESIRNEMKEKQYFIMEYNDRMKEYENQQMKRKQCA